MPTVVFDLDGTLADTSGDLLAAANTCFRDLGLGDLLGPDDKGACWTLMRAISTAIRFYMTGPWMLCAR